MLSILENLPLRANFKEIMLEMTGLRFFSKQFSKSFLFIVIFLKPKVTQSLCKNKTNYKLQKHVS